jgi:hypothetical protein
MASNLDAKLTKREEFVVWFTALLLIPGQNLDRDSKQRILRCAELAMAGDMADETESTGGSQTSLAQAKEELETIKKSVYEELSKMKKVLDACYGPSKDDREFSDFTN